MGKSFCRQGNCNVHRIMISDKKICPSFGGVNQWAMKSAENPMGGKIRWEVAEEWVEEGY